MLQVLLYGMVLNINLQDIKLYLFVNGAQHHWMYVATQYDTHTYNRYVYIQQHYIQYIDMQVRTYHVYLYQKLKVKHYNNYLTIVKVSRTTLANQLVIAMQPNCLLHIKVKLLQTSMHTWHFHYDVINTIKLYRYLHIWRLIAYSSQQLHVLHTKCCSYKRANKKFTPFSHTGYIMLKQVQFTIN